MIAVRSGNIDIVKILIENEADVDIQDNVFIFFFLFFLFFYYFY
jgi:hypothetical protein